jgi:hypothetical protein
VTERGERAGDGGAGDSDDQAGGRGERDEPEPGVDGGTGPGVTPGDVDTPGAATTPNLPDDAGEGEGAER